MYKAFKQSLLFIARLLGLFSCARHLTRNKLRILCYHGISYDDQFLFHPGLYIRDTTLISRLRYLHKKRFHFLTISEFEEFLNDRCTNILPVLVTIDDGWKSTYEIGLPIFKQHRVPHIIYLYTDCFAKEMPVLNVLLRYGLWKTSLKQIHWDGKTFALDSAIDSEALINAFLCETASLDKINLTHKLCEFFLALGVDYSPEREGKYFRLLDKCDIQEHLEHGGSFQLHTHHHINPLQDDLLSKEVSENKTIIENCTFQPAEHLCYPSGVFSRIQFGLLRKMGIRSAVTCIPGLNDSKIHPYELRRFLDGENITYLEFEAEMSGFLDLCRRILQLRSAKTISDAE